MMREQSQFKHGPETVKKIEEEREQLNTEFFKQMSERFNERFLQPYHGNTDLALRKQQENLIRKCLELTQERYISNMDKSRQNLSHFFKENKGDFEQKH